MIDLNDRNFLKSLRMLKLIARRQFRGQRVGNRKTSDKGASVDFKDYKEYTPGDDPRFVDWNVFGRLEKVLVKIFHSEQDVNVYVLVDASASMGFGTPAKFDHARKLAAAISYLATTGSDRCRVLTFAEGIKEQSSQTSRPGHILNLLRFLEKTQAGGKSDLGKTVDQFLLKHKRRGVLFLISDLFTPESVIEPLRRLRFSKYDVNIIHLLSEEELTPSLSGVYHFVDSEDQSTRQVTVDPSTIQVYLEVLQEMTSEVENFARQYELGYVRSSTSAPFESTVLQLFNQP